MLDILQYVKDPSLRKVAIGLAGITAIMVTVHYYHQIKLARLEIKERESKA